MRRVVVVALLLSMMVGLRLLVGADGASGERLTLASIGFVVLAAFAVAELGGALGLPKVTGYILTGIVLGPSVTNVMSADVVQEMRIFNTLALGLIALSAGLELDLAGLNKLRRTLLGTIAIKVFLGALLVGGVVFLAETWLDELGLTSDAQRLGLAIMFAALSLGTSPSITLAVIAETGAKGRLSSLVLGAAVAKDVVVVVAVAIALAVTHSLTESRPFGAGALVDVAADLGGSVALGAIVGALLIAYLRWINAAMLLFVIAVILVVAEVCAALHVDLLLVCIFAGLVVRNFSRHEPELMRPLQAVSLPVFIVFFTDAGAGVDLRAMLGVLPLALATCVARAVSFRLASDLGGRIGGEGLEVRRLAWLGYLPQAGVTLGILNMAAADLGGSFGRSVATLGMAMVTVHLLVGPITLRFALRRAGEIGSPAPSPTEHNAGP